MNKPVVTALLVMCLCAFGGVASAQQTPGGSYPYQAEQAARDVGNTARDVGNKAGGSNWGWLGLIGLAGLAGLAGRHAPRESTPRQTFRRDEPLGSR
jgi:hypothetical protein